MLERHEDYETLPSCNREGSILRSGSYLVSSLVEKLYVVAMSPAKAQPIAPAGVGARATPARVRALAQILTGFGSAANAEDIDSDSRIASTSFFMISSL